MALLMPNRGEVITLAGIVNKSSAGGPQDLILRLFKNNYTPVDGSTEANFTEATFSGYYPRTLAGASWTIYSGAPSYATYAVQTFTVASGSQNQNVYGYYLQQQTSSWLMWAERFSDAPYLMDAVADYIKVTPRIEARKTGE